MKDDRPFAKLKEVLTNTLADPQTPHLICPTAQFFLWTHNQKLSQNLTNEK